MSQPTAQIVPLPRGAAAPGRPDPRRIAILHALERKVLWLSSWMIHHANQIRPKRDGLKVGGHQASSASAVTLITALSFPTLRPQHPAPGTPPAHPSPHAIPPL